MLIVRVGERVMRSRGEACRGDARYGSGYHVSMPSQRSRSILHSVMRLSD
jgi:hypothetical protein